MARKIEEIRTDIGKLKEAERLSKGLVASLAVDCLAFLHEHGQSGVLNEMMLVLTPAHKKAVVAFFKEFSGFVYDKEEESFTKKIQPVRAKDGTIEKDKYADCKIAFTQFVTDGSAFWTWWNSLGKKDIPEASPLDLNKLTTTLRKAKEKADKQGIQKLAFFNAIVTDLFTGQEILDFLIMADEAAKKLEEKKEGK